MMKDIASKATERNPMTVIVLAGINGEKVTFICGCGKDVVTEGIKAGDIVKQVASIAGGNGGGKPTLAMAGAKDVSKVDDAIVASKEIIKKAIDEKISE